DSSVFTQPVSDADTVLLADINPLLIPFPLDEPASQGHMAHWPPPLGMKGIAPSPSEPEFWPWLFDAFDIPWPAETFRYSMDATGSLPVSPAYFNLGFVALNAKALSVLGNEITETTRRVIALTRLLS
ncbi:MAG: hypothetical protein ACRED5_18405, partial [Propylenella sp.]